MLFSDFHDFVDVARMTEEMHQNNGAGTVGNIRLNGFGDHVQRLGIYISKDRYGVLHEDWHNAAGIGDWGGDDFVAGVGINDADGCVDGGGPAR